MKGDRLLASIRVERTGFRLEVDVNLPMTGVTAVFGPSGAGKSTLLRCIAGLTRADRGAVFFGDEVWQDDERGTFVPTHRRRIGFVFQDARLFSHLTVGQNVEFGWHRTPPALRQVNRDQAVQWLGIGDFLGRDTSGLSRGERRRVAIAQSIVTSPRILLMDEPLAGLDAASRYAIMPYLEELTRRLSVPILYVTHSIAEVLRIAEHVLWIDGGGERGFGTVEQMLGHLAGGPASGDGLGAIVHGTVARHDDELALTEVDARGGKLWVPRVDADVGQRVPLHIHARDVSLGLHPQRDSSILNELPAEVVSIVELDRTEVLVRLRCGARDSDNDWLLSRVTRKSARDLQLHRGMRLYARVKAAAVDVPK